MYDDEGALLNRIEHKSSIPLHGVNILMFASCKVGRFTYPKHKRDIPDVPLPPTSILQPSSVYLLPIHPQFLQSSIYFPSSHQSICHSSMVDLSSILLHQTILNWSTHKHGYLPDVESSISASHHDSCRQGTFCAVIPLEFLKLPYFSGTLETYPAGIT